MEEYNIDKHFSRQKREEFIWMVLFILKAALMGLLMCALLTM